MANLRERTAEQRTIAELMRQLKEHNATCKDLRATITRVVAERDRLQDAVDHTLELIKAGNTLRALDIVERHVS